MAGNNYGSFVPTSNVWDVSEIYATEVTSPAFKELLVRLYQNLNNMSLSLNTRDAGIYTNIDEFVNGQVFFPNPANDSSTAQSPVQRQVYRKVLNFGALPNNTTKTLAHGIAPTTSFTFTRLYGAATDTVNRLYLPLPYASTTAVANNIELSADATNVSVKTGVNYSAYGTTYIILEYLKF